MQTPNWIHMFYLHCRSLSSLTLLAVGSHFQISAKLSFLINGTVHMIEGFPFIQPKWSFYKP